MTALPTLIGVSLKMYFSHARTVEWCRAVAQLARTHPAILEGEAELFVIPSYLSIPAAREILGDLAAVGAQDLAAEDVGAYTGEVSGAQLAEFGCRVVEVGHAERRRLFGETPEVVSLKTAAALRNGLTPVLCIGEADKKSPTDAAAECISQLDDALADARRAQNSGPVIVAYEPFWAIGAPQPASPGYIRPVCASLRDYVRGLSDFPHSTVIYGGSAGPGLLSHVGDDVDGLFLGRFSHDPAAIGTILDEVRTHSTRAAESAPS
ncbi:triose-phosphate isomerase family protein [Paramicrobacterium fandaimingii]|uniref:triose-phosphate isomerase family protein n=1 Tax=Paramicrobacterium fandaimingii TaxID=2708079 RepID=UPI00141F8A22|nr:triose-phosphate isomerase family protein [Microbacterium fandaimingii]